MSGTAGEDIRTCISIFSVTYVSLATTSKGGRTPPSDDHSKCLITSEQSAAVAEVIGVAAYAFRDGVTGILKGITEAKSPWDEPLKISTKYDKVSPASNVAHCRGRCSD